MNRMQNLIIDDKIVGIERDVILEERLVREIAPALKAIGVEDIVEYSINKIIHW